ncbi:MAG: hypothetical protein K2L21_10120 [Muribaculaceae bacterium]|nr:hypothetical protein [Muribaculaceae bacterium]
MKQQITLETLLRKIDGLRELLTKALDLLSKEKTARREERDEQEALRKMPPISNADTARLLLISTRQLQRVRRKYRLTWEARGRSVYYHIAPVIKAIRAFNLPWNDSVLRSLISNYRRLP